VARVAAFDAPEMDIPFAQTALARDEIIAINVMAMAPANAWDAAAMERQ
jgi:hypothetical protein